MFVKVAAVLLIISFLWEKRFLLTNEFFEPEAFLRRELKESCRSSGSVTVYVTAEVAEV
jgi:hypothetical protein